MSKIFVIIFAAFMITTGHNKIPLAPPSHAVLHKIDSLTVDIVESVYSTPCYPSIGPCADGYNVETGICAGVLYSPVKGSQKEVWVITAQHCVCPRIDDDNPAMDYVDLDNMFVYTKGGDIGVVNDFKTVDIGGNDDVRAIKVKFLHNHNSFAEASNKQLYSGEHLFVVGHPPAGYWIIQQALYIGAESDWKNYPAWTKDVTILCPDCDTGDSGGGVWDTDGHLVGFMNAVWGEPPFRFAGFLPLTQVLKDLKDLPLK